MAKVVVRKFGRIGAKKPAGSVKSKTVVGPDGRPTTVLAIDANSKTFGDDLQLLFAKNVRKARRENVKAFGSADRVRVR
jgi:hypothetical protein